VKKHRYKVSFSITTIIYLSLFLAYVVMMGHHFIVSQKEKDTTINLALSQFIPEAIEQPPEEIEEPKVDEEVEPEPEPEIVEPEPIPEPVVEEIPLPVP
jgi:outer membrane biosynthesis protein TonB